MNIADIENTLPNGLHDAALVAIAINYENSELVLSLKVNVENSDMPHTDTGEDQREGRIIVTGLVCCVIEPPDPRYQYKDCVGLWITSSGQLQPDEILGKLPGPLPDGAFAHYFFINDWNAFIYVAAMDARFEWRGGNQGTSVK